MTQKETMYLGTRVPREWVNKLEELASGVDGKSRLVRMALCQVYGFEPLEVDLKNTGVVLLIDSQYSKRFVASKLDEIDLRPRLARQYAKIAKIDSVRRQGKTIAKIQADGKEYSSEQRAREHDWVRLLKQIVKQIDG